jgi:hypothetical protein
MEPADAKERILVWILRAGGVLTALAFPMALLPVSTIAEIHAWLGLGEYPDRPITDYLARSLSLFYGFHGVLLLVVSTDVRRYRTLVVWIAWLTVALGLALLAIDVHAELPSLWTWAEGPPVVVTGFVMLFLLRSVPRTGPS